MRIRWRILGFTGFQPSQEKEKVPEASDSMRGLALKKSGKAIEQDTWCPPLESACVCASTLEHHVHRHHHQATQNAIALPCFSLANWRIRRRKGGRKEGGTEWGEENVGRIFEEF